METKKLKKILGSMISMLLVFASANIIALSANTNSTLITHHYGDVLANANVTIQPDVATNLLSENDGAGLVEREHDGKLYDLDSVTITRHRQKVSIEYYLGDYNTSQLIGTDEGYADYDDSVRDYMMSIATINVTFGQNIPATYRMVSRDRNIGIGYIPTYSEATDTYVVKVLIAEVKRYTVSAPKYQNRQDMQNPFPLGKTRSEIEAATEFWRVNTLSTSVNAIVGQEINLRTVAQITDTFEKSGRVGTLAYYGIYQPSDNTFVSMDRYVISDTTPTSLAIAGFYEVVDYGSPVVNPGVSSSVTSGSNIGFNGSGLAWKAPMTSEILSLENADHVAKLGAYPFNLNDDPFETPDYETYYVPANWMLGHRLEIAYNYTNGKSIVAPTPDPEIEIKPDVESESTKLSSPSKAVAQQVKPVKTSDHTNTMVMWGLLLTSAFVLIKKARDKA